MSQIILDFGSGNTCRNNPLIIKQMINELKAINTGKHEVIIKWQLFEKAGENTPLSHPIFDIAYDYAKEKGYKTTSSVFDLESLKFLLNYDVPFIKIANRRDLDWLIGEVPRKIPVYVSVPKVPLDFARQSERFGNTRYMLCVSEYPAKIEDYEKNNCFMESISDHTIGLDLFKKYQPLIWEKHYKLPDSQGLDAGPFAITPEELREVL